MYPKLIKTMKTVAFASLLAANVLVPHILSAQYTPCCKSCGYGSQITLTSRYAPDCVSYCAVIQCDKALNVSPNCEATGYYPCDYFNDYCDYYLRCS